MRHLSVPHERSCTRRPSIEFLLAASLPGDACTPRDAMEGITHQPEEVPYGGLPWSQKPLHCDQTCLAIFHCRTGRRSRLTTETQGFRAHHTGGSVARHTQSCRREGTQSASKSFNEQQLFRLHLGFPLLRRKNEGTSGSRHD